jgi:arabinan endo-1,5-alpha-L-arabinosidase
MVATPRPSMNALFSAASVRREKPQEDTPQPPAPRERISHADQPQTHAPRERISHAGHALVDQPQPSQARASREGISHGDQPLRSQAGVKLEATLATRPPKRTSWLRRTHMRTGGAILSALMVGSSFLLSGCGASDHSTRLVPTTTTTTTTTTTQPPQTPEALAAEELEAALRAGNTRLEYNRDFADPFVLRAGEATYFYATNAHFANVPVLDARAMLEGAPPREALPTENLGAWAVPNISHVWAPSVAALNDGRYAMFYSAQERATGSMAVGVAYADNPLGPFRDISSAPLLSAQQSGPAGLGGVIDASIFQENGRTFVIFKNDGNCCRAETAVWIQEFAENTGTVTGAPIKLLGDQGRQSWEIANYTSPHALIEGPRLVAAEGKYYLFYCANDWASANYGVNYAVADSLLGPYTRAPGPWMQSEEGRFGPGGPEIFSGPEGDLFLAYHAWHTPGASNTAGDARRLVIEPLAFEQGSPARPLSP